MINEIRTSAWNNYKNFSYIRVPKPYNVMTDKRNSKQ